MDFIQNLKKSCKTFFYLFFSSIEVLKQTKRRSI
ncbi:unnamed protein product [Larinioides sclopetarius]|uniref:Uncharacterized protein n=1 Tax=Larinioides sclopetarius TaxID=280406 RepID=A0AAV1YVP5_9ARAC